MRIDYAPTDCTPTDCTPTNYTPTDYTPTDCTPTDYTTNDRTPTNCMPIDYTQPSHNRLRTHGMNNDSTQTAYSPTDRTPIDYTQLATHTTYSTPTDCTPTDCKQPSAYQHFYAKPITQHTTAYKRLHTERLYKYSAMHNPVSGGPFARICFEIWLRLRGAAAPPGTQASSEFVFGIRCRLMLANASCWGLACLQRGAADEERAENYYSICHN